MNNYSLATNSLRKNNFFKENGLLQNQKTGNLELNSKGNTSPMCQPLTLLTYLGGG